MPTAAVCGGSQPLSVFLLDSNSFAQVSAVGSLVCPSDLVCGPDYPCVTTLTSGHASLQRRRLRCVTGLSLEEVEELFDAKYGQTPCQMPPQAPSAEDSL